ncbi:hypothetical protein ACFO1B_54640 [Dactylosporangium siamense]|nr:hypothetical protein [Dactylosporangium siamense]
MTVTDLGTGESRTATVDQASIRAAALDRPGTDRGRLPVAAR